MTRLILIVIAVVSIFNASCNLKNKAGDKAGTASDTIIPTSEQIDNTPTIANAAYAIKVKLNYSNNKAILDILPFLPDTAMKSFTWSKAERQGMLDMVKAHNYFIDTTKDYNTITKVLPYYFETQIVDGVFSVVCYKAVNGDYIVITKDQNGDGKEITCYKFSVNILSPLPMDQVLGSYDDYFMNDAQNPEGRKFFSDGEPYLEYSFTDKNKIIIDAPFEKDKAYQYLKGNSLTLLFNPETMKFDFGSVEWFKSAN